MMPFAKQSSSRKGPEGGWEQDKKGRLELTCCNEMWGDILKGCWVDSCILGSGGKFELETSTGDSPVSSQWQLWHGKAAQDEAWSKGRRPSNCEAQWAWMTFTGGRRWRRKWKERKWSRRSWPLFQDTAKGERKREEGRLSLSFLFFKDLSMFICWWGRHKHRSRRLKIQKEKDATWNTETVGRRGKPSPVTEGELVYRSQGKGWEVSLRIKRWGHMLRMVGGEVTSTDFLGNSYPFVWALPTQRQRCRFAPESGVFLCAKLPGSEEDSLLPGDVFIHTSFIHPGSRGHGKRTAPA